MTRRHRPALARLAVMLLLGACGTPQYYLLPQQPQPAMQYSSGYRNIVVSDFSLPAYAEAIEIPALQPDGTVELQTNQSWADDPRRGLTRHFAAALQARLGARVSTDPWPGFASDPELRVEVTIDRLIGAMGGSIDLEGQYFILRAQSGEIFASDRFRIQEPVQGEGTTAFVAAHGHAVEALADRIAARIAGRSYSS
jgi:uncharacterized protein